MSFKIPKLVQIKRNNEKLIQGCDIYIGPTFKKNGWKLKKSPWFNNLKSIQEYYRKIAHMDLSELSSKILGCICNPELGLCHGLNLIELWKKQYPDAIEETEHKYFYSDGVTELKGIPGFEKEENNGNNNGNENGNENGDRNRNENGSRNVSKNGNKKIRNRETNKEGLPLNGKKEPWPPMYVDECRNSVFVDECGMGCLFGYMAVCCVYIHEDLPQNISEELKGIHDSKLLKPHEREYVFEGLVRCPSITYHIEKCPVEKIDRLGLGNAWKDSIRIAVEKVGQRVRDERGITIKNCYLDGNKSVEDVKIDGNEVNVICEVNGDRKFTGISMASILGKVTRDKDIVEMADNYQPFTELLKKSKGYAGNPLHMALLKQGIYTDQHRKSFDPLRSFLSEQNKQVVVSKRKMEQICEKNQRMKFN